MAVKPDIVGGYIFKSSENFKTTHRSLKDHFIGSLKKSAYEINGLAITNVLSKLSRENGSTSKYYKDILLMSYEQIGKIFSKTIKDVASEVFFTYYFTK